MVIGLTEEQVENNFNRLSRVLSSKFSVVIDLAEAAVSEAYWEIQKNKREIEGDPISYWYVASKYTLFNFLKKEKRHTHAEFEDWMIGIPPELIEVNKTKDPDKVFRQLSKKLTNREWKLLNEFRKGTRNVVLAERRGISESHVAIEKMQLIVRCQQILNLI